MTTLHTISRVTEKLRLSVRQKEYALISMQRGQASDSLSTSERTVSERKCVCPLLMDVSALRVVECSSVFSLPFRSALILLSSNWCVCVSGFERLHVIMGLLNFPIFLLILLPLSLFFSALLLLHLAFLVLSSISHLPPFLSSFTLSCLFLSSAPCSPPLFPYFLLSSLSSSLISSPILTTLCIFFAVNTFFILGSEVDPDKAK